MALNMQLIFSIIVFSLFAIYKTEEDCSQFEIIIKDLSAQLDALEEKIEILEKENEELREWKRKKEEEEKEEEEEEEEEKIDENEGIIFRKLDTKIIKKQEEFSLLYKRLKKNNKKISNFKLLYRGSEDGKSSAAFHEKCDGISNTLSVIRSDTGYKFGGYAVNKWTENAFAWVYDDLESFVFSLDLMKIYDSTSTHNEKYHLGKYNGPQFWAFTVADYTGYTINDVKPFGDYTQSIYHDGYLHFSGFPSKYEINGGKHYYYVNEIEVYQIIYEN